VTINASWKFPNISGPANAALVAETDGLPPLPNSLGGYCAVCAFSGGQSPCQAECHRAVATPDSRAAEHSHVQRSAKSWKSEGPVTHHTRWRQSYAGIHFSTARRVTAFVSWSYDGSAPVEFVIQRQILERTGFLDKNPFERKVPDRKRTAIPIA
jgi:hypothetical protein